MTDERVVEEIITNFLLVTCRIRPQLTGPAVQAAWRCAMTQNWQKVDEGVAGCIPLITGSVAEFYIEPMIPHIGDVDVMYRHSSQLAIPQGHPPPTQLPDEFHYHVKVHEISDSHFPGYVFLKLRYVLTKCLDDDEYTAVEYDRQIGQCLWLYWPNHFEEDNTHGPARILRENQSRSMLSCDMVPCVRCLVWPPQAAGWPIRHRNNGWPDAVTVGSVVSNGCDLVAVAHRQCRQHKCMNARECNSEIQFRLSFSRAEIVLINSWMPVQQIVYHLLRDFMKTELLTGSADNSEAGTLSNYHIKTLMLWACELKPGSWWTDNLSLVRICVALMHDLADWLTEARCPHYFINDCNLIDSSLDFEICRVRLTSIRKPWLSLWFFYNYIRRCSQISGCPHNISRLFDDISTTTDMQNVVSAIVDYKLNTIKHDMLQAFTMAVWDITWIVSRSLTVQLLNCLLSEYGKISSSLPVYVLSVALLHIACRTERNGLNIGLMDVLSILVGQSIGPRRYSSRRSSVLLLSKAVNLMEAVDDRSRSRSTVQLIEIELSKAYLYRALSCEDSDSDSIYCLANVYLAVLYYTTGQYQTAIDQCTLVMRSQDHSQCSSHVVQGDILPKIDDDIDTVLGLAVFYQHVRIAALNQQQPVHMYVRVFTTELFAHYLYVKCLSVTECRQGGDRANAHPPSCEVQDYLKFITNLQQIFMADILLMKLLLSCKEHRPNFVFKQLSDTRQYPHNCSSKLNTSDLVELLLKFAVEHLTTFREMQVRTFGSVLTAVTTDFEALYAYKCSNYEQCLQLSTQNVHILLHAKIVTNVYVLATPFIQLMDDKIVSLTALTLIANLQCRNVANIGDFFISQLTLSLYLMTQCQLKLRQSLQSLTQTLCYIKVAHRRHQVKYFLDRLVLKMIARKVMTYITTMKNKVTPHNSC